MFHIVLFEPEIPPNTGNIIRLCANTGTSLHLIHPLGFELEDKQLRRAGLDYHEWASVQEHANFDAFLNTQQATRLFACSTKGTKNYSDNQYQAGDAFIFGPESRGLPNEVLKRFTNDTIIRVPMLANSRSLNLSNVTAIIVYEAWRQQGFATPQK